MLTIGSLILTESKTDSRKEGIMEEMTDKKERRYCLQILKNMMIESNVCPCN